MRIILGLRAGSRLIRLPISPVCSCSDGHEVQAVLTRSAEEFVSAVTFASLTGRKVFTNLFRGFGGD